MTGCSFPVRTLDLTTLLPRLAADDETVKKTHPTHRDRASLDLWGSPCSKGKRRSHERSAKNGTPMRVRFNVGLGTRLIKLRDGYGTVNRNGFPKCLDPLNFVHRLGRKVRLTA